MKIVNKTSQVIGKYLIKQELASGAMGTVYLGYDPLLDRNTAIKVIKTGMEDENLRKRFFLEGQAVAKLDHPNIVKIWGMDTDAGNRPYIAMEYVEGDDLKSYIEKRTFVPFEQKLRIIINVCMGLQHAHDNGVIHRDIKPANIQINKNGEPKILDFGLARYVSSDSIQTNSPIGTPYYMSPEQWKGEDLDRRSDLFSIAAVLYEFITYIKTFEAASVVAVMNRIVSEPHVPLVGCLPACAPELSRIVDLALAKERKDRYTSCLEFANALEKFSLSLARQREEVLKKVDLIEGELHRCNQEASELLTLQLLDSTIFDYSGPREHITENSVRNATIAISDYGVLIQHHASLQKQLDSVHENLRAALPLKRLLNACQQQLDEGKLESCERTLEELLKASPGNPTGLRIREACRRAQEERRLAEERKAKLQSLLAAVRQQLQHGSFSEASETLKVILEMDPLNRDAQKLGNAIQEQKALAESWKKARIADLLEVCRLQFRTGDFSAFRRTSEELLKISRDAE